MAERPDEPLPYRIIAAQTVSDLVITCEHASNALPESLDAGGASSILRTHWAWDPGAWILARQLARRLGGSAVGARFTRLVVDLNRPIGHPTLVRSEAEGVVLPWNAGLSADELEERAERYHVPYHDAVDRLIYRRLLRGVRPFLLAMHSFTPVLHGAARPFDVGILYHEYTSLARALGERLRHAGLVVRYNQPYSGHAGLMYSVQRHSSHYQLPCVEIEVNQRLVRSRDTLELVGEKISTALAPVIERSRKAAPAARRARTRARGRSSPAHQRAG